MPRNIKENHPDAFRRRVSCPTACPEHRLELRN